MWILIERRQFENIKSDTIEKFAENTAQLQNIQFKSTKASCHTFKMRVDKLVNKII